jgi:hypothetical protein
MKKLLILLIAGLAVMLYWMDKGPAAFEWSSSNQAKHIRTQATCAPKEVKFDTDTQIGCVGLPNIAYYCSTDGDAVPAGEIDSEHDKSNHFPAPDCAIEKNHPDNYIRVPVKPKTKRGNQ